MAFVRINKSAVGSSYHGNIEIRMGSRQADGKSPRGVYFSISQEIIHNVGWTPHITGDHEEARRVISVYVHEGVGKDAGFWMIEQTDDPKGYALGTSRRHSASYTMNVAVTRLKHYALNDIGVEPAPINYSIETADKAILIECPDWLRYNPLTEPAEEQDKTIEVVLSTKEKARIEGLRPNREQRRQIAKRIVSTLRT